MHTRLACAAALFMILKQMAAKHWMVEVSCGTIIAAVPIGKTLNFVALTHYWGKLDAPSAQ